MSTTENIEYFELLEGLVFQGCRGAGKSGHFLKIQICVCWVIRVLHLKSYPDTEERMDPF